ncbi:MAG: alkaline phosphatase family protein [Lysinibacillus sp.]
MAISKYCIVISYDAFSKDNWALASSQPNLSKLLAKGVATTNVKTVYPSLTYVIHSSYVTGAYPNKHSVYHNNPLQPFVAEKDQDWHWFRKDIQLPTIYEAAREIGLMTASILWPVTGKAKIDFNIPEIKAVRGENQVLKILKSSSKWFTVQMEMKYGKLRQGIEQPYLDDFITAVTVDTIKSKKPNLLLVHLIDLDDAKHTGGTKGKHIDEVTLRMDRRIGDIVDAVHEAGIYDETTFIVVGDHSQLDVRYMLYLNKLLYENGLIYQENGQWRWRAYVQGAGGAAYVHIQPDDVEAEKLAIALIADAIEHKGVRISNIFNREQVEDFNAYMPETALYMLDAEEGYAFEDAIDEELVVDLHARQKVYATHGYSPKKPNYTSNLLIAGQQVSKNTQLGDVSVVDIAPTIAHILGIPFQAPDGKALKDVFK